MGCEFELVLAGQEPDELLAAGYEALEEIDRIGQQLSHYLAISDLSYLNAMGGRSPVRVEPRLYELLERARELSEETGGAFDPTIGPLVKLWGFYQNDGAVPPPEAIAWTLQVVGMKHLIFDPEWNSIQFDREGIELNLGAIGKGYAVQRAADLLRERGVENALIHGGSSTICALGAPPGEEHWLVGLRHPERPSERLGTIRLRDEALSTSGGYEQFFVANGRTYSHLLDPRTGYPAEGLLSASVITPGGTESDALSTAFFIMGIEGATEYCQTHPEARAVLVSRRENGQLEITQLGPKQSLEAPRNEGRSKPEQTRFPEGIGGGSGRAFGQPAG